MDHYQLTGNTLSLRLTADWSVCYLVTLTSPVSPVSIETSHTAGGKLASHNFSNMTLKE